MAGGIKLSISILMILHLPGILTIQNDRTSLKASADHPVLSASAFLTPDRTINSFTQDEALANLQKTSSVMQLQTSEKSDSYYRDHNYILKSIHPDERTDTLISSKRIDHIDENNIEVKSSPSYGGPSTGNEISGEEQGAPRKSDLVSEPQTLIGDQQPRYSSDLQRQPRLGTSKIYSDHAPPPFVQVNSPGRQANPDIQDIITGIVKLLNGNVKVSGSTNKPLRPIQTTRINNRGPPRISDVPLPLDFDPPGVNLPPLDGPYLMEKPPVSNKPSINQLLAESPMRPYGAAIPVSGQTSPTGSNIWNRPYRPGNNRQPIPPYKPLPPVDTTSYEVEEDNVADKEKLVNYNQTKLEENFIDKNTTIKDKMANLTVHKEMSNTSHSKIKTSTAKSTTGVSDSTLQKSTDRSKFSTGIVTSVTETSYDTEHLKTSIVSTHEKFTNQGSYVSPSSTETSSKISQSVPNIKPHPTEQTIEPTQTITEIQTTVSSSTLSELDTVTLQPSKDASEKSEIKLSTLPTEALPTIVTMASSDTTSSHVTSTGGVIKTESTTRYAYKPRPGIVLDDTLDYTRNQGHITQRPFGPGRHPVRGDIFDVTVSAIQGPDSGTGESVRVSLNGAADVILTTAIEGQRFVSIDGKRTYLNLFDNTDSHSHSAVGHTHIEATKTQGPSIAATGYPVSQGAETAVSTRPNVSVRRPTFHRRPTQPPIRIDTCIVGDATTCDASQHEACATIQGVSACHCKPGYARLQHSLPCKRIISIVVSIRVDRIYDKKIVWDQGFSNKDSEPYQTLAYEANRAIESAISMTPFSDEYMGSLINNVYQGDVSQGQGGVFVNTTLKLLYEPRTTRPSLAGELQKHLLGVIHRRNNNIGNSALYVDSPPGSISNLHDLDECSSSELNDCHASATCTNTWGGFTCSCNAGLKDVHKDDPNASGRSCISCSSAQCNNRGTCFYTAEQMQCTCTGNYYGAQCEIDGEVLGVAIGASVTALIIIVLTLICLVMWSRKWSQEQKTMSSPVYGYMQRGIPTVSGTLARVGSMGTLASTKQGPPSSLPPYLWPHIADQMAAANVYAAEPMVPTRPSSAIFGYPSLPAHGTLPPVPLPRLQAPPRTRQRHQPEPDSSDSEPQDKDRADLIPQNNGFLVPRPKSRLSLANQSGIYSYVEYDQGDAGHLSKNNIPLSTYSMGPYYRT